jgi:arylsulfatase A-like enzyme
LTRRSLLRCVAGASAGLLPGQQQSRRPNVVVILADDQGWGDLSIHGNRNLSTPSIDSIGKDGALFDRFFVCPVCSPTRAEFLTGRYHARSGVRGTSTGAERMNLDERTIAETFKAAGYTTGAFGKWHNGSQHPYHPNARGFDEYYGFTSGHWGQYFDPELDHNGRLARGKGYITDDLTNHALDYLSRNRTRPFFCYLAYNTPHSPMQAPDRFYRKFAEFEPAMRATNPMQEEIGMTRAALAMVENLDWNVGRVLAKLDELKLAGDTVVLYFSDNGPNSWRWNGGMKGRKGSTDEGGIRSPLLIRWPGHVKPSIRIPQIAGAIDLLPTLADLAGIRPVSEKPLDGKSLKPLLLGQASQWPDRMIFTLQGRRVSVRTQQHRLDSDGRLYDMVADPAQERDVSQENPQTAARLREAVAAWSKEMLPLVGRDERPYPVGHAALTLLPARDGVPGGGIERSSKHPNCSYFKHWTRKEDSMTWDIEVAQAGEYEAEIYYACHKEDVGSTVELSFEGAQVRRKIDEAHDPPLIGAKDDRYERSESYVKDFKPCRMGVIRLAARRGILALRAVDVAGKEVAEVRYVSLTRRGAGRSSE